MISHSQIISAFSQGRANNCASIALIKASIETFGINNVFSLQKDGDRYHAILRNSNRLNFTDRDLYKSIEVGDFVPGTPTNAKDAAAYSDITTYARLCYAVMVAQYQSEYKMQTFEEALTELNDGVNSRVVAELLGLQDFASEVFTGNAEDSQMIAWQHMPWLKHTVYMSHGTYDYFGTALTNTGRFPKRIRIGKENTKSLALAESTNLSPLYFINVSRKGTFEHTRDEQTKPEHIDKIFEHIKEKSARKILLYFHGGLISEDRGMDDAQFYFEKFGTEPDTHVITFVWETGIFDAIPGAFARAIRTDDFLRKLIMRVARLVARRYDFDPEAINTFAESNLEDYARIFEKEFSVSTKAKAFSPEEVFSSFKTMSEEESEERLRQEAESFMNDEELSDEERIKLQSYEKGLVPMVNPRLLWIVAKIAYRCIRRFISKRDHGVWPTIVEESCREIYLDFFGSHIWDQMKWQAKQMWLSNEGRTGDHRYAGRYFLDSLMKAIQSRPLEITVVGHSAGSIAICEWVNAIKNDNRYSGIDFKNVIFLAPACTCELFSNSIVANIQLVKRVRVFTMKDEAERQDYLLRAIRYLYPRSLLYLISGILEGTSLDDADTFLLGLHRHIRKKHPYSSVPLLNQISDFLILPNEFNNRLALSPLAAGPEGWLTGAIHHGGFSKEENVVASIRYLIRN